MTIPDLFFLGSVLFVATFLIAIGVSAVRRRWGTTRRLSQGLAIFITCYAIALIGLSFTRPRRIYPPTALRCFDDWCVAALNAEQVRENTVSCSPGAPDTQVWLATIQVSSQARRIRQRARDARAELEDERGARYAPCGSAIAEVQVTAHAITDYLDAGESFSVRLPFRLPKGQTPAGLLVHHGDFPGIVIIGADQSLFHVPALQRLPRHAPEPPG